MPYDPLWVGQLAGLRGRTVEPAAGPRGTRCMKGSIPLGGSPRLLSVTRALLPKRVFTSRKEGASPVSGRGREPVSGKLGGFSWTFTQERRTGEGCVPFREKQACRFSVNTCVY